MGAIKDLTDLVARLVESVQDRKFAAELREVQRMIGSIQSEQAAMHEQRMTLITENADLKQKIAALEQRLEQAQPRGSQTHEQLDEISEKMLLLVANTTDNITKDDLIQHVNLPRAKACYYFDQLLNRKFVRKAGGNLDVGWYYAATPEGREYLVRRDLI